MYNFHCKYSHILLAILVVLLCADISKSQDRFELVASYGADRMQKVQKKNYSYPIVRSQEIVLNKKVLRSGIVSEKDLITLNFFDEKEITVKVGNISTYFGETRTMRGSIEGSRFGYFVSSVTAGKMYAVAYLPDQQKKYEIGHNAATNTSYVTELSTKQSTTPFSCSVVASNNMDYKKKRNTEDFRNRHNHYEKKPSTASFDNTIIELMIVYTPEAELYADRNSGGILNAIGVAIGLANRVFENSDIDLTLFPVHITTDPSSPNNAEEMLYHLYNYKIDELREVYKADLVAGLFMYDGTGYGGFANIPRDPQGNMNAIYSATTIHRISENIFTHEIGHNLGSHHSRNQQSNAAPESGGVFEYSTGWRWDGEDGKEYASVMTYEESGTRVPIFSSPDIRWAGAPAGSYVEGNTFAPSDNSRSIREMKDVVASYYESENPITDPLTILQNYPNPFNPSTTIEFALLERTPVKLEVFNVLGKRVGVLINETRNPGWHEVNFDGTRLASGIYYYRLQAKGMVNMKAMTLIR